ncbi:glycosyltransferase [Sphingomonas yabuuchiae]|uniref:glycosyltransferase n=1 Tax=Sphingomonas yabuuchiae TaxID=172044 RepID=UPI0033733088
MMVSGPRLPLATARNAAAEAAVGDKLVFLDMDCIPTPNCWPIMIAIWIRKTGC